MGRAEGERLWLDCPGARLSLDEASVHSERWLRTQKNQSGDGCYLGSEAGATGNHHSPPEVCADVNRAVATERKEEGEFLI